MWTGSRAFTAKAEQRLMEMASQHGQRRRRWRSHALAVLMVMVMVAVCGCEATATDVALDNTAHESDKEVFQIEFKPTEPPAPTTDTPPPTDAIDLLLEAPVEKNEPKKPSAARVEGVVDLPRVMAVEFKPTTIEPPTPTPAEETPTPTESAARKTKPTESSPKTPTPTPTQLTAPTPTKATAFDSVPTPTPTTKPHATQPTTSVSIHPATTELTLADRRAEHARLSTIQGELTKRLIEAQVQLQMIELQIRNEQRFYEDAHANNVVQTALPSPRGDKVRQLSCRGWKKTNQCRSTGSRHPEHDKTCFTPVHGGGSGYCEVRDDTTKEYFKVMRANCTSVPVKTTIWCQLAPQFANFPAEMERAMAATPVSSPRLLSTDAIVMVVLSSQIQHAQRAIRALRSLNCKLLVELWYFESEMSPHMDELRALVSSDQAIVWRPLHTLPFSTPAVKFAKIHAIAHSAFANVLYLDPLVLPLRDPTYLFKLPEFLSTGAIFWPDLFHPGTTESNIQPSSLLWELLDMPAVRMFEQDDRQLLIRRDAALVEASLRVLEMMSMQRPNLFERLELVKRGKDLFRLAWLKTKATFHMLEVPPTIGGRMMVENEASETPRERLCGTHVVQHDPSGRMLFMHRDSAGDEPRQSVAGTDITHVQTFDWLQDGKSLKQDDIMYYYDIRSFTLDDDANKQRNVAASATPTKCFAHAVTNVASVRYETKLWDEFPEAAVAARLQSSETKLQQQSELSAAAVERNRQ